MPDARTDTPKRPQMEPCSWCNGFGLVYGYMGEPTDCWHCGYSGVQEARDERGRFLPWVPLGAGT